MARRDDDEGFNFDDVEETESTPAALDATEVAAPEVRKMREKIYSMEIDYIIVLNFIQVGEGEGVIEGGVEGEEGFDAEVAAATDGAALPEAEVPTDEEGPRRPVRWYRHWVRYVYKINHRF